MIHAKKNRGFTLPEIFITLGIVAIVLSMAVPGLNNMIKDNKLVVHLNAVVADIHFARSEAAKRDVRVIMCRSAAPTLSSPVCGGDNYDWSSGYIIFADDGNYTNNIYDAGTDVLLRRGMPDDDNVKMRTNTWWNINLEFNTDGSTNEGGLAAMSFCDDRGILRGKQIQVGRNGIPKLFTGNIGDCTPHDYSF